MGTAVVVADVFSKNAFGVALVADDDVVETLSTERADHPFAVRVCLGRSRWRHQARGAEALHPLAEPRAVDRIAIVDQETGRFIVAVADGLDEGLGRELRAGRGRDGDT
jgi:hypothetical protein